MSGPQRWVWGGKFWFFTESKQSWVGVLSSLKICFMMGKEILIFHRRQTEWNRDFEFRESLFRDGEGDSDFSQRQTEWNRDFEQFASRSVTVLCYIPFMDCVKVEGQHEYSGCSDGCVVLWIMIASCRLQWWLRCADCSDGWVRWLFESWCKNS